MQGMSTPFIPFMIQYKTSRKYGLEKEELIEWL